MYDSVFVPFVDSKPNDCIVQLLNRPHANSFLTQAFNLSIIHIFNNAMGQKSVLPLPIYLPSYREADALFRACQARLFSTAGSNNHLTRFLFSVCKLSVLPFLYLLSLSVSASLNPCYIMAIFLPGVYSNALWNCFLHPTVVHSTYLISSPSLKHLTRYMFI